ncbi:MAG: metal-dependent transcriptional regulator [Acidobacteriota bacterium]|jgi:DtxR family Mn-dependent transcriptional regulator|nr:metal-dependent transcriptional regulator [Acidobacteriota bacterium]
MENRISEEIVEVLEAVWTLQEQAEATVENVIRDAGAGVSGKLLDTLSRDGLLSIDEAGRVRLLPRGREMAEPIIRRHRLAERLICDVLGSHVEESEVAACEYEHLLAEGITNSICTLLGHPRYCPHNRPIPEGECCRQAREDLKPIVVSCDQLRVGESAKVAYFSTREHSRLLKLSALGISPGISLRLIQKWPAYVVQCEETEIALEPDIAKNIYVWQSPKE